MDNTAEIKEQTEELLVLAEQLQALDKKRQEVANAMVEKQGVIKYLQANNKRKV